MSGVAEAHAVAAAFGFSGDRFSFGVGAIEEGHFRDVGEPNLPFARQDSGGDAVEVGVEFVGVNRTEVRLARSGTVFEKPDDFGFDGEVGPLGPEVLFHHGRAVFDRPARQIVLQHEHVVPDIEDAGAVAMGLGNEDAPFFVEAKRDRVGQHRFGGPQVELHAGRDLELARSVLGFRRRRRGLRGRRARIRFQLRIFAAGSGDVGTEQGCGGGGEGAGGKDL